MEYPVFNRFRWFAMAENYFGGYYSQDIVKGYFGGGAGSEGNK